MAENFWPFPVNFINALTTGVFSQYFPIMKFWLIAGSFLLLFAVSPVLIELLDGRSQVSGRDVREMDWKTLSQLDYKSDEIPKSLREFDGHLIKVPGFMVPLEDNLSKVSEFILVPDPQSCIHVPPPPPNQMIMVKMKEGNTIPASWRAVWVFGELKISPSNSPYGKVSYTMEGNSVEAYEY